MPERQRPRILVYLTPKASNETLLTLAERHAERRGASVLAVSVLQELPWYARFGTSSVETIHSEREQSADAWLDREVAPLARAGVRVETRVAWGRPFDVIIQEALRHPTQLVMKTAHGDGPLGGLLGSTAMHLLRKCPTPVWVVKPGRNARIRTVLAAVDPVNSPDEGDLNAAILRLALETAVAEDAALHVFHGYSVLERHHLHHPIPDAEYHAYTQEVRERLKSALAQLIAPLDIKLDEARIHILPGEPGSILPSLISKIDANLLVMGTLGRAGIPGLLIGNTAERMLSVVDCSVLAIKPDRFVSPVAF